MILEIFNGYVRGHYNPHGCIAHGWAWTRAHPYTHTLTLLSNHPAARERLTATPPFGGRSSSDEQIRSACALTPMASISRWPTYRVGAMCRSPDNYDTPTIGYPLSPSGCPDSNLFLLANFFESCSFFRGSGSNFKSFYLIKWLLQEKF